MTDDDLVKAREAERVMREYAAHPSSFTVPDSEQARSVADLIAALTVRRGRQHLPHDVEVDCLGHVLGMPSA